MNNILTHSELTNALLLANLSNLAYRPQSEIQTNLPSYGLSFADFFSEPLPGTQGFCAKGKDLACFVFRGTSLETSEDIVKFEDVIVDLLACPVPFTFGKVHFGFRSAFAAIKDAVSKHAKSFLDLGLPVYFAGHSLGGALAVLAAAVAIDQNIPVAGLYTFGQPRVGNAQFAQRYLPKLENRYYRFTNAQDIVPHVPPYFFSYRHLGETSFHFTDEGKPEKSSSRWEWIIESAYILGVAYCRSGKIRDFIHQLIRRKLQKPEDLKVSAKKAFEDFKEIFERNIVDDHDIKVYIKLLQNQQDPQDNSRIA